MRQGLLIGVAVVALAVGAAIGVSVWRGATRSELTVASVLTQRTAYYVEARDLRGLIAGVRKTQAWKDIESSGLLADADEDGALASLASELDALSERLDYPLDEATAMKLLGDEAALAVWVEGDGETHLTMVTRIDAEALATDLLTGELDGRALQAELNRRVGQTGVEVATEEHEGYDITTAIRGETVVYATLLEDLLVVSDHPIAVRAAIDLRNLEGEDSLETLPAFREELARLPEGAALREWINVDVVRTASARIAAGDAGRARLSDMVDGIAAPTVARAIELPENDLYRLGWTWSRTDAELFVDGVSPSVRRAFPADAIVHFEMQRLGQLAEAWRVSGVRKHIEGSWAARKLEELVAEAGSGLQEASLARVAADVPELSSDEFAKRFGWHMMSEILGSTFGTEAAMAVWRRPDQTVPAMMVAVRLDTDGRMIELFVRMGLDMETREGNAMSVPHRTRTIRGSLDAAAGERVFYVAAGDLLLVANDLDVVKTALDRIDGVEADMRDTVTPALTGMPEGHRLLMVLSPYAYVRFASDLMDDDPEASDMLGLLGDSLGYESVALAAYVTDDLSRIDVRTRARLDRDSGSELIRPWYDVARGAPQSVDVLPDRAIWTLAVRADLSGGLKVHRARDYGVFSEALDEGITEFEQAFEVDVDDALIPSLGDEIAFSLLFEDEPASAEIPPIPGMAFLLELEDRRPMTALMDRVSAIAHEMAAEDAGSPDFVREDREGVPLWRIVQRPVQEVPFDPTVTFFDDFLVMTLDDSTMDDMHAVKAGTRRSHAASDLATRIRAAGLSTDGNELQHLDWDLLLDQCALYAPQLAEVFVDEDALGFPEYPDDGDEAEWERRLAAYSEERSQAARGRLDDVIGAIDSLRFIEFMAGATNLDGDVIVSHGIIQLRR